jgi:hypothetical protein
VGNVRVQPLFIVVRIKTVGALNGGNSPGRAFPETLRPASVSSERRDLTTWLEISLR